MNSNEQPPGRVVARTRRGGRRGGPVLAAVMIAPALLLGACGGDSIPADAAAGRTVATENGCIRCHNTRKATPGTAGPAWVGLWGSEVELVDGSKVRVDEAYVTESIRQPQAKLAKGGFAERMPTFNLSDDDIAKVIAYLKYLQTPPE